MSLDTICEAHDVRGVDPGEFDAGLARAAKALVGCDTRPLGAAGANAPGAMLTAGVELSPAGRMADEASCKEHLSEILNLVRGE